MKHMLGQIGGEAGVSACLLLGSFKEATFTSGMDPLRQLCRQTEVETADHTCCLADQSILIPDQPVLALNLAG